MTILTEPSEEHLLHDETGLVAAAQDGDSDAFAALVRRHDDAMRGVAWRVAGSQSAMDDILQEAYLKAWRGLAGFRLDAAFSSWLYSIVYRSAIDWQRRQRPTAVLDVEMATVTPDHASGLVESFALREALASLSAEHLCVVTLIDGEGRSYDDVAELLDISPGTVGSRLARARAALRNALTETSTTNGKGVER